MPCIAEGASNDHAADIPVQFQATDFDRSDAVADFDHGVIGRADSLGTVIRAREGARAQACLIEDAEFKTRRGHQSSVIPDDTEGEPKPVEFQDRTRAQEIASAVSNLFSNQVGFAVSQGDCTPA